VRSAVTHTQYGPPIPVMGRELSASRRAVSLDPSCYEAHVAAALAYRETLDIGQWRQEAQTAIALNPRLAEANELLADSYAAMPAYGCARDRNPALADDDSATALRIDPRFTAAHANCADHLYWSERIEEAVAAADRGLAILTGTA